MSATSTRSAVLTLYKTLLRGATEFPDFNFRSYSLRRIKHGFRESQALTSQNQVKANTK